ncbi:recombination regulator RecX [Desulfosarcina sp. OttesenSCG-928-A07]|nr:recombination regulator RecX [Desulfosarcina sp. OttesenSCG-928-A07]
MKTSPPSNRKKNRSAMETALAMLTRRDHTTFELRAKLCKNGFSETDAAHAINQCQRLGYLDDMATASALADQLVRRGYGAFRIHQTLSGKGLDEETIRRILDQDENLPDELETARQALEKKRARFDREPDPGKRWQKAYRFLAGRGFSSDVIRMALEMFKKGEDGE